jgi:hypothetical protein
MVWTLATITAQMGNWLGIPTTDQRRLPQVVREGIVQSCHRELARRSRWRFLEFTAPDDPLITGQAEYDLPEDWSSTIAIRLIGNNTVTTLEGITYSEYLTLYPDIISPLSWRTPETWTISGASLMIGPPPDSVVSGSIRHTYQIVPVDLDADENLEDDITKTMGEALLYYSLVDACAYIFEEARIPFFKMKGDELFDQARTLNASRIYSARRPVSREP